jgi:putative membrane protein
MGLHEMMYGWDSAWSVWAMVLGMSAFWIAVVGLAIWALKSVVTVGQRTAPQGPPELAAPDQALDALRRRYAAGEIDRDEFDLKRRDLA